MTRALRRCMLRRPPPFWLIDGAPVWYTRAGSRLPAFVDGAPWVAIGRREWCVRLRGVETVCGTIRVPAATLSEIAPRTLREERAP
jgi:hypothetical protein